MKLHNWRYSPFSHVTRRMGAEWFVAGITIGFIIEHIRWRIILSRILPIAICNRMRQPYGISQQVSEISNFVTVRNRRQSDMSQCLI